MPKNTNKTIKPGSRVFRSALFDRSAINEDDRTVDLAFSSEEPYDRHWGREILDHSPNSIDLSRMSNGAPLLMDHNPTDQVGVIESVEVGQDRVGRATVRFGRSQRADEVFQDVVDGIRKSVSVGYQINDSIKEGKADNGLDIYRVTDWTPFEASMVAIPADLTVGVGRSAETESFVEIIEIEDKNQTRSTTMPDPVNHETEKPAASTVDVRAIQQEAQKTAQSEIEASHKRVDDIIALGEQYAKFGGNEMAREFIRNGKSVDEMRAKLLEKAASGLTVTADIGLNDKETRQFSIMRALNALADPGNARLRDMAAFEFECSRAVEDKFDREAQGIFLPNEVLNLKRELTVGVATAGGDLVATNLLAGNFIEFLRNAMVLSGLGVRTLAGLVGDVAIPRQTAGATVYWVGESTAITEADPAFDQVAMTPHTVGGFTQLSRKLLKQSSPDVEALVLNDLATQLGLGIESVGINGGGANEPTGILSATGTGSVVAAADAGNGGAPAWGDIVDLETQVAVANAAVGQLAYLANAKTRGKLKKTFTNPTYGDDPIWGSLNDGEPSGGMGIVNGYKAAMTNAVPSNGTEGTGTNLSSMIYGNFNDMLIGMWGGLDITVDPYSLSTSGSVKVVALQDVDIALRHAASFAVLANLITT